MIFEPTISSSDRLPARELAQRRSGTHEVQLLWHPENDRVALAVRDVTRGVSFRLDIDPGKAMDAFYHPFAYVARRSSSHREVRAGKASIHG
jgi:hypothetical protein